MKPTNTNYDTKHNADKKAPAYILEIDGLTEKFCTRKPADADSTYYALIPDGGVTGLNQTAVPEKGKLSIGGLKVTILDTSQQLTALMAADSTYLHRKQATLKQGYVGLDATDFIQEGIGWITDQKRTNDGTGWVFSITDPQKWLQKVIFRNATESSPITIAGNAVNILLSVLTSSDSGTNSDYDLGDSDLGCGLDSDSVNVSQIEGIRDTWFWRGPVFYLSFTITKKIKAKDFIERELLGAILNVYPAVDGEGKLIIKPVKPPMASSDSTQSFSEAENILDTKVPAYDMNLPGMINEVDFEYDYDSTDDEYDSEIYWVDGTSYNGRGPSKQPLKIKSRGLHSDLSPSSVESHATYIISSRAQSVFNRYAVPPVKISFEAKLDRSLSEAGDIVPFTHSMVPDVEAGTLGVTDRYMEVVSATINRKSGRTKFTLLDTGFAQGIYSAASPAMTVVSGSSSTAFTVSVADAAKWTEGWEAKVLNVYGVEQATVTILTINTGTGAITCDSIGQTPAAGWGIIFADYDDCTTEQQRWGFIADSSNYLGTANDAAHIVSP